MSTASVLDESAPALSVRSLTVTVDGHRLVDGVSLEVPRGGWLTLVGPNGAGKTTVLRAVTRLVRHDGSIRVHGRDAATSTRRQWARLVALVPQVPVIPAGMTVHDYALLGRTPHLRPLGAEGPADLAAVAAALQRLDLGRFAHRTVTSLSGGERQRVLVARLLAQDAPVALLDEPTSALDVGHQQQVLDLVDELRRSHGLTVVTTMHDLTLAAQYGDRLALLDGGRVVAEGTAGEVLTAERLSAVYGARVRVLDDGPRPVVVPVR